MLASKQAFDDANYGRTFGQYQGGNIGGFAQYAGNSQSLQAAGGFNMCAAPQGAQRYSGQTLAGLLTS